MDIVDNEWRSRLLEVKSVKLRFPLSQCKTVTVKGHFFLHLMIDKVVLKIAFGSNATAIGLSNNRFKITLTTLSIQSAINAMPLHNTILKGYLKILCG